MDSHFVPHRILHSPKHILSWDSSVGLNLDSDFDAFESLMVEVIALCVCLKSLMS